MVAVSKPHPGCQCRDADEVRWIEGEKDPPLADPLTQFTGPVFEGLHNAAGGCGETYQGGIDPCLDDATRRITARAGAGVLPGMAAPVSERNERTC